MAVVLEARAVEPDHLLRVLGRPEDVVREEPVAVVRGLLGDLRGPDRAVPHERRHAVERARRRGEALERRPELALPVDDVLAPQPVEQRVVLDGELDALADVLAEPRVDGAGVAPAEHEVHPPVGEVLEGRVVLGDPDRVGRRDEGGRGGQDDPRRLRGDVGQRRRRRRTATNGGLWCCPKANDVEPDRVGLLGDLDLGLDPLVLGRGATGGRVGGHVTDGEDAELHGCGDVLGSLVVGWMDGGTSATESIVPPNP